MFSNREEAGRKLAKLLKNEDLNDAIIISLPRGGVVVGCKIAKELNLPHEVLVVKKIGAPSNPELALGATGSDGMVFWDSEIIESLSIPEKDKTRLLEESKEKVRQLEEKLKVKRLNIEGKTAVVVDDGVATGATAIVASMTLTMLGSRRNILAVPVISKETKEEIEMYYDKIITAELPRYFRAVGEFYEDFPQIEDEAVIKMLKE